jgi:hypothetical protein
MLGTVLLSLAMAAAIAAAYTLAAWRLSASVGRVAILAACWPVASVLWAVTLYVRIRSAAPEENAAALRFVLPYIVASGVLAFGASSLLLFRHRRRSSALSFAVLARSVGAFFLGLLLAVLPALIADIGRLGTT